MADINYWGLTGTKRSVTGITLATATVDTLITAIATDEGLPADYYHWSLLSDPSKNSITYGDSSTKLSAIGITDGATVLCTPQQNESKQERQLRKLYIAQAKKQAFGDVTKPYYRVNNTFDITLLPDTYATAADDNPNTGGLVQGRPWINIAGITFDPDIYFYNRVGTTNANGYFGLDFTPTNDDLTFFDNPVVAPVTETQGTLVSLNITAQPQYNSIMLLGYFLAPTTETYTFFTNTDDASYMWIGPNAISGYTHTNAIVQNGGLHGTTEQSGTISLIQNIYYPIRIMFGNNTGPGTMIVSYSTPTITKTSTWTGRIFHNSATNGF